MAEMEIVPVYRGNEMVLPITGVNAVMDGEGNNLPMIFAKKDATTSDAWDPDITYTTGQYCLDNNTLWRCLIQNENTKPTEGTYWTRETIGNNLVTTDGEGNRGYLKADGSFSPFSGGLFVDFQKINVAKGASGIIKYEYTFNEKCIVTAFSMTQSSSVPLGSGAIITPTNATLLETIIDYKNVGAAVFGDCTLIQRYEVEKNGSLLLHAGGYCGYQSGAQIVGIVTNTDNFTSTKIN